MMNLKQRIVDKLLSGRFSLLIMFGLTLCSMAFISLLGAMIIKDKQVLSLLTRVLDTLIGFIGGTFSTMMNAYSHRPDRKNLNDKQGVENEENINTNGSIPVVSK